MRKLIYRYLNENYLVSGCNLYQLNKKVSFPITSATLVSELSRVFGFDKGELKWFIKHWIHKQNKGFPFRSFWSPKPTGFDNIIFPIVRRVFSPVLGQELVTVESLSAPTGIIFETTPVVNSLPVTELATRYASIEINPNYYSVINISGTTTTDLSNLEKTRKETIKKWQDSGILNSLHSKNIENLYKNQMKQIIK